MVGSQRNCAFDGKGGSGVGVVGVGGGGITHVLRTSTCLLCVFGVLVRAPHCLFVLHLIAFAGGWGVEKVKSPSSVWIAAIDTLVIQTRACYIGECSLHSLYRLPPHNMHPTKDPRHTY